MWATENKTASATDNELDRIDAIKSKDHNEFKLGMQSLENRSSTFNAYQNCYFEYLKGYGLGFEGNYNEMVGHLNELFNSCQNLDNQVRIKLTLANIHVISRDYEEAFIDLAFVVDHMDQIKSPAIRARIYSIAAIVYRLSGQSAESIQFSELMISQNFTQDHVCKGHYNMLRIKMEGQYSEALMDTVNEAIEFCLETNNHIESHFLKLDSVKQQLTYYADNPQKINQLYEDLKALEDDIEMTQYHNLVVYHQSVLAVAAWHAGNYSVARDSGVSALELNDSLGNTSQKAFVLDMLIADAIKFEEYQLAYQYLSMKYKIDKEVFDLKSTQSLAYFRVKHANQARNFELSQLKQRNNVLKLEQELSKEQSKKQKLMMLLVLSLLILLGLWTYKIKRKHDYFKEVAEIDHLTQVFTRKAFEEHMKAMLAASKIKQEPVNLAIMDLDHFKNVNDQHGHLVGDWVLKAVIKTCEQVADQDIMIARLGGEEFALVCPGISLLHMMGLIDKLRMAIEQMDCSESGSSINITASFGVTNTELSGARTSMLLTHADLALFEAKNNGRNQVVSYDSKVMKSPVVNTS